MLEQQGLDNAIMDKLADKVARFHLSNTPVDQDSEYGDIEHIRQPVMENFTQVRDSRIQDPAITPQLDKIEQWSRQQLDELRTIIASRKARGYVRECHGDMHLRNIALWQDDIIIFDCIEFNENLYWIDVMSDIAFLVMDLEDRQQATLAQRFLNSYLEITGDYEGLQVLLFYKVYRAMVRAKVAALRCVQADPASDEFNETLLEFQQYINLAETYTRPTRPCLIINFGLSGAGKSVGTRLLAERLPAIQLRSDVERKRLFNVAINAELDAAKRAKLYSLQATNQTYARLVDLARCLLEAGYAVIIDAANLKQWQRQLFIGLARSVQVAHFIVAYHADEAILKQRVVDRAQRKDDVSDATLEVLHNQLQSYEPLTNEEQSVTIEIDTSQPVDIDVVIKQLT
jgi:predicted kinase